jgi:hypothetical protein
MIKKICGYILLGLGTVIGYILLTYGGPVLPHFVGPVVMVAGGMALLILPLNKNK